MAEQIEQMAVVEQPERTGSLALAPEFEDDEAARLSHGIALQLKTALGLRPRPGPEADASLAAAMEVVAGIGPNNALEGMLATQMVAT